MDKLTHVYTVEELDYDIQTLVCVCATKELADEAVAYYMDKHGGEYEVRRVKLNWGDCNDTK